MGCLSLFLILPLLVRVEVISKKFYVPFKTDTLFPQEIYCKVKADNNDTISIIFYAIENSHLLIKTTPANITELTEVCDRDSSGAEVASVFMSDILIADARKNSYANGKSVFISRGKSLCFTFPVSMLPVKLVIMANGILKKFTLQNEGEHGNAFENHDSKMEELTGAIYDLNTGRPAPGTITLIDKESGEETIIPVSENTGYKVLINPSRTYRVICSTFGFPEMERELTPGSLHCDFFLPKLKKGHTFVLENVYFYPNTYAFKKGSEEALEKLVDFLKRYPDIVIEIGGHTAGNTPVRYQPPHHKKLGPEWNFIGTAQELSEKRAGAVKKYLVKRGINPDRLKVKGYADTRPLIPDPLTPEEREKNMRVEITILKSSPTMIVKH